MSDPNEVPWLSIIGLGEDGPAGLTDASKEALARAEIVFGGPRHLALLQLGDRGHPWPIPFDLAPLLACRGHAVAMVVSGDPFWYGAGGSLARHLSPEEWQVYPVAGVFSLAAARLGWRLESTVCLGLHNAPYARLLPHLHRDAQILATLRDGDMLPDLAGWLEARGFGAVELTVLEALGGPRERMRTAPARRFPIADAQAPVTVALDGRALGPQAGMPRTSGLADHHFAHKGQITKQPVRAVTLAALGPRPGAILWDIGGGSGSISIEWALAGGLAFTVENRRDRADLITQNIEKFGLVTQITLVESTAPAGLSDLPEPDAIFIGGGATIDLVEMVWERLPKGGRLVANAVMLETETLLQSASKRFGGALFRMQFETAEPLGTGLGWQAMRPIVQWSVTK